MCIRDRSPATISRRSASCTCARSSAPSPRRTRCSAPPACPRPAPARSCAASCARSPRASSMLWATPPRWPIRPSSRRSRTTASNRRWSKTYARKGGRDRRPPALSSYAVPQKRGLRAGACRGRHWTGRDDDRHRTARFGHHAAGRRLRDHLAGRREARLLGDDDHETGLAQRLHRLRLGGPDDVRDVDGGRRTRRGAARQDQRHEAAVGDLRTGRRILRDHGAGRTLVALLADDLADLEDGDLLGGLLVVESAGSPSDAQPRKGDNDEDADRPDPAAALRLLGRRGDLHLRGAEDAREVLLELRRGTAARRVLLERAQNDLRKRRRRLWIAELRRLHDPVEVLAGDGGGVRAVEDVRPGEEQVEHEAEPASDVY